jgi:hypothetical protein
LVHRVHQRLGRTDLALVGLTLLAFVLAFHQLGEKSIWLDEAGSAVNARHDLGDLRSVVTGSNWYDEPSKEDFRGAANFVVADMQAGDGIVISPEYADKAFSFYAGENGAAGLSRIGYRGARIAAAAPRIWLVTRKPDTPPGEQRRIERDIASAGYERVDGLPSFTGVGVTLFRASPVRGPPSRS